MREAFQWFLIMRPTVISLEKRPCDPQLESKTRQAAECISSRDGPYLVRAADRSVPPQGGRVDMTKQRPMKRQGEASAIEDRTEMPSG